MAEDLASLVEGLGRWDDRPAIRQRTAFRNFSWSYGEVRRTIAGFRRWYGHYGLARGDRLVIWAPSGPDWVFAYLAAILSGIVIVPLDLHSSPDFVQKVIRETEARLVLYGREAGAPDFRAAAVSLGRLSFEAATATADLPPPPKPDPNDLVEIVYTSGTTALPRGVMLTHRNLASNLNAIQPIVPAEPFYRFLSVLPLSHVFEQVVGLLLPLSRGGSITYLESIKPSALLEAFRGEQPNVVVSVPRFLELLRERVVHRVPIPVADTFGNAAPLLVRTPWFLRRVAFTPIRKQLGGELKYLVVGGAPLDRRLEEFWDALGLLVLQGYGLTEAGPIVAANTPRQHRIGSVGRPLAGTLVRIGRDGELLVAGPGVTPGYYQRPDLNARAFVDGFLRTGDLGCVDHDGFLYLRGRQKDLIVTSAGLNVYPEDIELVLNREPGVRDSAVLEWDRKVFAVLLLDPRSRASPAEIIERANHLLNPTQRIADWSVWPGADFPRTPTLKVQKYKVREALTSKVSPTIVQERPRTQVARIIQDLAPERRVTPDSRLAYDLDLGSLDRLELIAILEDAFHLDLPEDQVTANTTVSEVEYLVQAGQTQRPWRPRRWPLTRLADTTRSVLQDRLVFPLLRLLLRPRAEGLENVTRLVGPFILAGNHVSHLDTPAVLMVLPKNVRRDVAVAALATFYFPPAENPWEAALHDAIFGLATLVFNTYPVPRASGFRESLRYAGYLVDHRWNILLFPEGTRHPRGHRQPFREGIGLLANALQVPVVPFFVEGTYEILPRGHGIPRAGRTTIRFGQPLTFPPESPWAITRAIEAAVAELGERRAVETI